MRFELLYGIHPIRCALGMKSRARFGRLYTALDELDGKSPKKPSVADDILRLAIEHKVEVIKESKNDLNTRFSQSRATVGRKSGKLPPTQGFLLEASPLNLPVLDRQETLLPSGVALFADGVVDPQNLGAMLRTAYILGADSIVVGSRHGASLSPAVSKSSAGALEALSAEHRLFQVDRMDLSISALNDLGWHTVALSVPHPKKTVPLSKPPHNTNIALVVGNEGAGVRPLVQRSCIQQATLTLKTSPNNYIDSLNASVAAALALHTIL